MRGIETKIKDELSLNASDGEVRYLQRPHLGLFSATPHDDVATPH